MPQKKQKPSNRELLIHWACVGQHQQVLIAEIVQCLGAPLLPGLTSQIHKQLSVVHFENWLNEKDVPLELIARLLAASFEERATREAIGDCLRGSVVSKLLDEHTGRIGNRSELDRRVSDIRSVFMVGKVKAKRPFFKVDKIRRKEDHEDARSDAFEDAWKNLSDQTERILREKWSIPVPQTEFEAALFERWQTEVLPSLNAIGPGVLACLTDPEAVNYIPARRAKDQIDRIRHATAQKRESGGAHLEYDETLDDELVHLSGSGNSAEDKAIEVDQYRELLVKIYAVAGKFGPETRRAITLILRGESQKDAAKKEGIKPSTLNERIIKIRTEMKRTHPH